VQRALPLAGRERHLGTGQRPVDADNAHEVHAGSVRSSSVAADPLADELMEAVQARLTEWSALEIEDRRPLQLQAAPVGGEPIGYDAALGLPFRDFSVGEQWGAAWDTWWFRLGGEIPPAWAGRPVVVRLVIGDGATGFAGEGMLWRDGRPVTGVAPRHSEYVWTDAAAAGERVTLLLEAAANPVAMGAVVPDGVQSGPLLYTVSVAELAVVRDDVRALTRDLRLLRDLARLQPERDDVRDALRAAVGAAPAEAAQAMQSVLGKPAAAGAHRVIAVGNAHIDTAWLWPFRETRRKTARTLATAFAWMARYPDYHFALSQPQQVAWLQESYPDLFARLREQVAAGQVQPVGAMWVEPDCNVPSGESLVRQLVEGKRYWQQQLAYGKDFAKIDIPVLQTAGYYFGGPGAAVYYLTEHYKYKPDAQHYLVIGPYDHFTAQRGTIYAFGEKLDSIAGYPLDPVAQVDLSDLRFEWFDYVLRGGPKPALLKDKINYEVTGANVWKHAPSIAAMAARTMRLDLNAKHAAGGAMKLTVDLADRSDVDRVEQDVGVTDKIDARNGITFISEPIADAIEWSGLFAGHLELVTNKRDFDFTVQPYVLSPRGKYTALPPYWSRASHVDDATTRHLLTPGKRQTLSFMSRRLLSHRAEPGSRLVVVLSVIKEQGRQINYGTGKDISDATKRCPNAPGSTSFRMVAYSTKTVPAITDSPTVIRMKSSVRVSRAR